MVRRLITGFGLVALVTASPLPAQESDDARGHIRGTVVSAETGEPVAGVEVVLAALDRRTLTSAAGSFTLGNLPAGRRQLSLRHIGYGIHTVHVDIRARATTVIEVPLEVRAIELEPLEVRVEGRIRPVALERGGFYEREEDGWGVFWDPEAMERAATGLARFDPDRFFKTFGQWDPWRLARRRGCRRPEIYVNGRKDRTGLVESLTLSTWEIGAIEVYRDTHGVPPWALDRQAGCGVVAIWLRRW